MTKTQLDQLGKSLERGDLCDENLRALADFRNAFIPSTGALARAIASQVRGFKADITKRPAKSTLSIIAKLKRESCRLTQMQDIGGVRVVVSKISVQNNVVGLLNRLYPQAKVIDRRERPQNGYRAVHVVVQDDGRYIEVQIRTRIQNAWAQLSEKLADLHGQSIKYGDGPVPIMKTLDQGARLCALNERLEIELDEYKRATINEFYRKKKAGRMGSEDRRTLDRYREALLKKRKARALLLNYMQREMEA